MHMKRILGGNNKKRQKEQEMLLGPQTKEVLLPLLASSAASPETFGRDAWRRDVP